MQCKAVIDTLSQIARLNVQDFESDYLEIVPYTKTPNRPFGDGIGVISFSQIYFDTKWNKGLIILRIPMRTKMWYRRSRALRKERR
jgi:hypothetical protein